MGGSCGCVSSTRACCHGLVHETKTATHWCEQDRYPRHWWANFALRPQVLTAASFFVLSERDTRMPVLQQRRSNPRNAVATGVRASRCHACVISLGFWDNGVGPPGCSRRKFMQSLLVPTCLGMPLHSGQWRSRCCSGSCASQASSAFVLTTRHSARSTCTPVALLHIFV